MQLVLNLFCAIAAGGGTERKLSSVSDMNDMSVQMLSGVCSKTNAKSSRAGSDAGKLGLFYKKATFEVALARK